MSPESGPLVREPVLVVVQLAIAAEEVYQVECVCV